MLSGEVLGAAVRVPGSWPTYGADLQAGRRRVEGLGEVTRPAEIPAGRWRRMSRLSRWCADAVIEVLPTERSSLPIVLGSAMGEVVPSSVFLNRLFLEGPERASPTAFQNSVYNATAAHLSIVFELRDESETLSAGMATGWMGVARGLELLERHERVLVVLADDRNPTTERAFGDRAYGEAVVALLLGRGEGVSVMDGLHPAARFGRLEPLPYEGVFTGWSGADAHSVIGLHPAGGVLASLATGSWSVDMDDGLQISGRFQRPVG